MRGRMGGMVEKRPVPNGTRVALTLTLFVVMGIAIIPCATWFEEDVLGSHNLASFYRAIGIDAPMSWVANTFERLTQ
jgi:hypothetical protein